MRNDSPASLATVDSLGERAAAELAPFPSYRRSPGLSDRVGLSGATQTTASPPMAACDHFIIIVYFQRTTSPVGERNAKTPQRLKDERPAADMFEFV